MGSYKYVVGDSSLKLALNCKRDCQEEKIMKGEEGSDDMEQKKISIGVKADSYSVSKIWLWSKKRKLGISTGQLLQGRISIKELIKPFCQSHRHSIGALHGMRAVVV